MIHAKRIVVSVCFAGLLFNSVCVPAMADTAEIIIDGVVVQEKKTPGILKACEMMQAYLAADMAAGNTWVYSNSGKKIDEQWQDAISQGKRACNCALLARWAMRESGLIGQYEAGFWGVKGGDMHWGKNGYEAISRTCEIYHVNGSMTVQQMLDSGQIIAGDVVTYVDIQHTNIYAGNGMWYDGGHAYCNGDTFTSWYGPTVYGSQKVGWILRPKDSTLEPIVIEDITPDIVIESETTGQADDMGAVDAGDMLNTLGYAVLDISCDLARSYW